MSNVNITDYSFEEAFTTPALARSQRDQRAAPARPQRNERAVPARPQRNERAPAARQMAPKMLAKALSTAEALPTADALVAVPLQEKAPTELFCEEAPTEPLCPAPRSRVKSGPKASAAKPPCPEDRVEARPEDLVIEVKGGRRVAKREERSASSEGDHCPAQSESSAQVGEDSGRRPSQKKKPKKNRSEKARKGPKNDSSSVSSAGEAPAVEAAAEEPSAEKVKPDGNTSDLDSFILDATEDSIANVEDVNLLVNCKKAIDPLKAKLSEQIEAMEEELAKLRAGLASLDDKRTLFHKRAREILGDE